jgi:hypothetical protein
MALAVTFGSLRPQAIAPTVSVQSGGSTTSGGTLYLALVGMNRIGFNQPSTLVPVTWTAGQKIVVTIPTNSRVEAEDLHRLVLAASTTNDATQLQPLAWWRGYNLQSTAPGFFREQQRSLTTAPTIEFTTSAHLILGGVATTPAALTSITSPLDGMQRWVTSLSATFYYSESDTQTPNGTTILDAGTAPGNWLPWRVSGGVGSVTDLAGELGCSRDVRDLDDADILFPPPPYPMDGTRSSDAIYWIVNGYSETGSPIESGTRIGLDVFQAGAIKSLLFDSKIVSTLQGYVRLSTAALATAGLSFNSDSTYRYGQPIYTLESNLPAGYAIALKLAAQFKEEQLGGKQSPGTLALEPKILSESGNFVPGGQLFGNVIYPSGARRRVYPLRGAQVKVGGGSGKVGSLEFADRPEFTLSLGTTNQDNLKITLNGNGDVFYRGQSALDSTEVQRALVWMRSGRSAPGVWSSYTALTAGQSLVANCAYPTAIRADYPDPAIAESDAGELNATTVAIYVQKETGGEIREFLGNSVLLGASQTFTLPAFTTGTVISSLPAATPFGMFAPGAVTPSGVAGGSFVADRYRVCFAFAWNGTTASDISHRTTDGCIEEWAVPLTSALSASKYWGAPLASLTVLRALPLDDIYPSQVRYVEALNNPFRFDATSTATDDGTGASRVARPNAIDTGSPGRWVQDDLVGPPGPSAYTRTTASFTQPAVNATVSVGVGSTAFLFAGQPVSVAGGGFYAVSSITNATTVVLTNLGGTGNTAPAATIATNALLVTSGQKGDNGASGANAYTVTTANFNQPSVGSNVTVSMANTAIAAVGQPLFVEGGGFYTVSSIASGTSISLNNNGGTGNAAQTTTISSGAAVRGGGQRGATGAYPTTTTTASFTQPAVNSTVTAFLTDTSFLSPGQTVFVSGGGFYTVSGGVSTNAAALLNVGGTGNSTAGSNIASGSMLAVVGQKGDNGASSTTTTSSYTQPAIGSTVTVSMASTALLTVNLPVFVGGAGSTGGSYIVTAIGSSTSATLRNLGGPNNLSPTSTVPTGLMVVPQGNRGEASYTTTTASFIQPAINSTIAVSVASTAFMAIGLSVFVTGGGSYSISSIGSATSVTLTNLGVAGSATPGSTVATAAQVVTSGAPGLSAYATVSSNFTQPAIGSSVTVAVSATAFMSAGMPLYVAAGGFYAIASVISSTSVSLTNSGGVGNVTPGATVAAGGGVIPTGQQGSPGANAYTPTTAGFTQPAVSSTVVVAVADTSWMSAGQPLFVGNGGFYSVSAIGSPTSVTLTNSGGTVNATAGATIPSGSIVSPSGTRGDTGATGATGSLASSTGGITFDLASAPTTTATQNAIFADSADGRLKRRRTSNGSLEQIALSDTPQTYTKSHSVQAVVLADAATINIDAAASNIFRFTLGGNRTIANPTNLADGETLLIMVIQDATGGRIPTWGTAYDFGADGVPAYSTTGGRKDILSFLSDGTKVYFCGIRRGFT